jgi:hypothetical protein
VQTAALIGRLRRLDVEPTDVEVKSGAGGLPTSVGETISAFANGTGGTLLIGVDETAGFVPVTGFDAPAVRDALADACANKVEPPCLAPIEIEEVDGCCSCDSASSNWTRWRSRASCVPAARVRRRSPVFRGTDRERLLVGATILRLTSVDSHRFAVPRSPHRSACPCPSPAPHVPLRCGVPMRSVTDV